MIGIDKIIIVMHSSMCGNTICPQFISNTVASNRYASVVHFASLHQSELRTGITNKTAFSDHTIYIHSRSSRCCHIHRIRIDDSADIQCTGIDYGCLHSPVVRAQCTRTGGG